MSQHDYVIDNQSGASFRSDLNSALSAIVSQNSAATEPSTKYAYMWWADTTNGLLKIRNAANSAWITVGSLADNNLGLQPYDADTAKTDVSQTFTAVQKSTVTTDNDLTINISSEMDVLCTPTAGGTLTFSGISTGIGFEILFINNSNYAITKGSNIKCPSNLFSTLSVTGRYRLTGKCFDGTNVDLDISARHV